MNDILPLSPSLPGMSQAEADKVRKLEAELLTREQVPIQTTHHFHAGLYYRTIRIPAGVMLTGALIVIPTLLIISGHISVFTGAETLDLQGYHVLTGMAGRKQAFLAHADTHMTMTFATQATTVEEAEAEFTLEPDTLMSRQHNDDVVITGE